MTDEREREPNQEVQDDAASTQTPAADQPTDTGTGDDTAKEPA